MKFWLVSYVTAAKGSRSVLVHANVLLAGLHPVIWLSCPPAHFAASSIAYIVSFHEIDEVTFEHAKRLRQIPIEDYRMEKNDA